MSDLLLDIETGDLVVAGGEIPITEGTEIVRQRIEIALRTFRGEWFLDTLVGVPYYEKVLGKKPNPIVFNAVFVDAILGVEGVNRLIEPIRYEYLNAERKLNLQFAVETDEGIITGAIQI